MAIPQKIEEFIYALADAYKVNKIELIDLGAIIKKIQDNNPEFNIDHSGDNYAQFENVWGTVIAEQGKEGSKFNKIPNAGGANSVFLVALVDALAKEFDEEKGHTTRIKNNIKKIPKGQPTDSREQYETNLEQKKLVSSINLAGSQATEKLHDNLICRDARKAIAHILANEVFRLDPVIGDAACEMRPPFVLDMSELIIKLAGDKRKTLADEGAKYIKLWAAEEKKIPGWLNHAIKKKFEKKDCNDPYLSNYVKVQISEHFSKEEKHDKAILADNIIKPEYSEACQDFLGFCEIVKSKINEDNFQYLGLCKIMTTTRLMVYDRLGISLGDHQTNNYPPYLRGEFKSLLGRHSVRYMREISNTVSKEIKAPNQKHTFKQLADILKSCDVTLTSDSKNVAILPIYEAMRLITTYEMIKGRPLVFTVNRLKAKKSADYITHATLKEEGVAPIQNVNYSEFKPEIIIYTRQGYSYIPYTGNPKELLNTPCTGYEAYSIIDVEEEIDAEDELLKKLLTCDNSEYFEALKTCDLGLLMRLYAASHPPMSSRGKANGPDDCSGHTNFKFDNGVSYMLRLQDKYAAESRQPFKKLEAGLDDLKTALDTFKEKSKADIKEATKAHKDAKNKENKIASANKKKSVTAQDKEDLASAKTTTANKKKALDQLNKVSKANQKELESNYDTARDEALVKFVQSVLKKNRQEFAFDKALDLSAQNEDDVFLEYIKYRSASMTCGMLFNQEQIEKGKADQIVYHAPFKNEAGNIKGIEYRYADTIFFRISHIYPTTLDKVQARVNAAIRSTKDYKISRLIDEREPASSIDDAIKTNKDCYFRDDQ